MNIENIQDIDELIESHEQEMEKAFIAGWCASEHSGNPESVERARDITKDVARICFGKWMVYQGNWDDLTTLK